MQHDSFHATLNAENKIPLIFAIELSKYYCWITENAILNAIKNSRTFY